MVTDKRKRISQENQARFLGEKGNAENIPKNMLSFPMIKVHLQNIYNAENHISKNL